MMWCPETESNRHVLLGTRDFKFLARSPGTRANQGFSSTCGLRACPSLPFFSRPFPSNSHNSATIFRQLGFSSAPLSVCFGEPIPTTGAAKSSLSSRACYRFSMAPLMSRGWEIAYLLNMLDVRHPAMSMIVLSLTPGAKLPRCRSPEIVPVEPDVLQLFAPKEHGSRAVALLPGDCLLAGAADPAAQPRLHAQVLPQLAKVPDVRSIRTGQQVIVKLQDEHRTNKRIG